MPSRLSGLPRWLQPLGAMRTLKQPSAGLRCGLSAQTCNQGGNGASTDHGVLDREPCCNQAAPSPLHERRSQDHDKADGCLAYEEDEDGAMRVGLTGRRDAVWARLRHFPCNGSGSASGKESVAHDIACGKHALARARCSLRRSGSNRFGPLGLNGTQLPRHEAPNGLPKAHTQASRDSVEVREVEFGVHPKEPPQHCGMVYPEYDAPRLERSMQTHQRFWVPRRLTGLGQIDQGKEDRVRDALNVRHIISHLPLPAQHRWPTVSFQGHGSLSVP